MSCPGLRCCSVLTIAVALATAPLLAQKVPDARSLGIEILRQLCDLPRHGFAPVRHVSQRVVQKRQADGLVVLQERVERTDF